MFNPAKTRIWKDGVTPATGTIALGSYWDAEFDQLYENWNEFFNATGDEFSIDQVNVNNLASVDGDGINFTEYFGYNIDAPVTQIHVNEGSSGAAILHFTNTTTGATASDGFDVGIDASEQGRVWNYENTDLILGTNNTARVTIANTGAVTLTSSLTVNNDIYITKGSSPFLGTTDNYKLKIGVNNTEFVGIGATNGYLSVGGAFTASNPLHVQSTTTPQVRIAYDADSYWTVSVVDGGGANLVAGEAGGFFNLYLGVSNPIFGIVSTGATAVVRTFSNGADKYIDIYHNDTNGVINTGGASAGSITIPNTTNSSSSTTGAVIIGSGGNGGLGVAEDIYAGDDIHAGANLYIAGTTDSSSKDTGCAIFEGGIGVEKNIYAGGNIYAASTIQATSHFVGLTLKKGNSWSTSDTQDTVYDALLAQISGFVPTNPLNIAAHGTILVSGTYYPINYVTYYPAIGTGRFTVHYGVTTYSIDINNGDGTSMTTDGYLVF